MSFLRLDLPGTPHTILKARIDRISHPADLDAVEVSRFILAPPYRLS
jgi:hypothetical protein